MSQNRDLCPVLEGRSTPLRLLAVWLGLSLDGRGDSHCPGSRCHPGRLNLPAGWRDHFVDSGGVRLTA